MDAPNAEVAAGAAVEPGVELCEPKANAEKGEDVAAAEEAAVAGVLWDPMPKAEPELEVFPNENPGGEAEVDEAAGVDCERENGDEAVANGEAAGALAAAPNRGVELALVPNAGVEALLPKNEVVPKPNDAPITPPHYDRT